MSVLKLKTGTIHANENPSSQQNDDSAFGDYHGSGEVARGRHEILPCRDVIEVKSDARLRRFRMEVQIEVVQPTDAAVWAELRWQLWPDCPPERHRLEIEQLLAADGVVVLAKVNGQAVGFSEVSIRVDHVDGTSISPVPYLEGWYVTEPWRGKGVGRSLIQFVEAWARQRGYRELASDAEIENEHSIRLHGKLGFREVERTVHFVKELGTPET